MRVRPLLPHRVRARALVAGVTTHRSEPRFRQRKDGDGPVRRAFRHHGIVIGDEQEAAIGREARMAASLAAGRLAVEGAKRTVGVDRKGGDPALVGALDLADGIEAAAGGIERQPARVIDFAMLRDRLQLA